MITEQERYKSAQKRVKEIQAFYSLLTAYIPINVFMVVVDAITGPGWWFYWFTMAISLAVVIQAVRLFGPFQYFLSAEWEEEKIRELMEQGEPIKRKNDQF